jgi:class 3 adenylate cyclase
MTATRRLAAILAADVAGYSRLMGADEDPLSSDVP